jgi:hypothetical protein
VFNENRQILTPSVNIIVHSCLAFLVTSTFLAVCYLGLPIDFNADYTRFSLHTLQSITIKELLLLVANPLTPGWFYPPHGFIEYLRPIQTLLFHICYNIRPHSLVPFQWAAVVGYGFLSLTIFLIVFKYSRNILYAWLAVILNASFPSNYFIMHTIVPFNFQFYGSLLSLISLVTFHALSSYRLKFPVIQTLVVFIFIVSVWLNTKLHSTEKIIPFVCFAALFWRARYIVSVIGIKKYFFLLFVVLSLFVLVVPFRPFKSFVPEKRMDDLSRVSTQNVTQKDRRTFSFSFKNGYQRTFHGPGGKFALSTIHRRDMPKSFTENLGFFVGWFFWLLILLLPALLLRQSRASDERIQRTHHFLWIVLIWFSGIIIGFASGSSLTDLRFIYYAYIPALFLFFITVSFFRHRAIPIMITASVLYSCCVNGVILTKTIGHFGGMQDVLVKAEKDVFTSFYGRAPESGEIYKKHEELEGRAVIVDWYELPSHWFRQLNEKISREGKAYFYTREHPSKKLDKIKASELKMKLIGTYELLDAKPAIFRFLKILSTVKNKYRKIPKKSRAVRVYEITY